MTILCLNISHIAIITAKNADYRSIIRDVNKSEAINLSENYVLEGHGYIQKTMSDSWLGVVTFKNAKHLKKDKERINASSVAS